MESGGKSDGPAAGKVGQTRYHHGALAEALLTAAEVVLRRDGLERLTLRAVAREASVSHTAPQHHFGDLAGLLSELAAVGFTRFRDTMLSAANAAGPARGRGLAQGYLAFARDNPGLFLLMFRSERLDMSRPSLRDAARAAFAVLAESRAAGPAPAATSPAFTLPQAARVAAAWSFVHGLAFLAIDGRLDTIVDATDGAADVDALIEATLSLFAAGPPERGAAISSPSKAR